MAIGPRSHGSLFREILRLFLLSAACFRVCPSLLRWRVECNMSWCKGWPLNQVLLYLQSLFANSSESFAKDNIRSTLFWFTQSAPRKTRAFACPAFLAFLGVTVFCMTFHWPGSPKGNIDQQKMWQITENKLSLNGDLKTWPLDCEFIVPLCHWLLFDIIISQALLFLCNYL